MGRRASVTLLVRENCPRILGRSGLANGTNLSVELPALDEALTRLSRRKRRQARVAELRLFAGMLVKETAFHLGVSERTVNDDWRVARAWLPEELSPEGGRA